MPKCSPSYNYYTGFFVWYDFLTQHMDINLLMVPPPYTLFYPPPSQIKKNKNKKPSAASAQRPRKKTICFQNF